MPANFTKLGAEVWKDFNTTGVPASGKFSPRKADIRVWAAEVEAYVKDGVFSGLFPSVEVRSANPVIVFTDTDRVNPQDTETLIQSDAAGSIRIRADSTNRLGSTVIALEIDGQVVGRFSPSGFQALVGTITGEFNGSFTNAKVASLANLALAANRLIYATGENTLATAVLTAAARALLDDGDAIAMQETLQVPPRWRRVNAGSGLIGGGDFFEDRTISIRAEERMTTANVLAQAAAGGAGAVGWPAMLELDPSIDLVAGTFYPGGSLRWSGFWASATSTDSRSSGLSGIVGYGTWQCLGAANGRPGSEFRAVSIFMRVA